MVKIYMEEEQKLLIFHKKHNFFLYFALKNTIFWVKLREISYFWAFHHFFCLPPVTPSFPIEKLVDFCRCFTWWKCQKWGKKQAKMQFTYQRYVVFLWLKKVLAIKIDQWYALCSGFVCVLWSVCRETLVKQIKNGCKTA